MSVPTLYDFQEAAAEALSASVDAGTGVKHQTSGADANSTPSALAQLMNLERKLMLLLEGSIAGKVVWSGSGLTCGAYPIEYELAGTAYSFPGDATYGLSLPVSDTSYVYLDADEALESQITDWPSGDHFKLAKVTTNGTQVTEIVDMRWANLMVGIVNAWWAVAPTADVDMNVKAMRNLKSQAYADWSELTIASGVITPTQGLHTVDTESDAASDDLDTITATAGSAYRRVLILCAENAARVVTVKHGTGNVTLLDGDFDLDDADKMIVLLQDSDTTWVELSRNKHTVSTLEANLDANDKDITGIATLNLSDGPKSVTISSGAITRTGSYLAVNNEGGAPTDDLDTVNGGSLGDLLILEAGGWGVGETPTVKHNTGNVLIANDTDYALTGNHLLVLLYHNHGGVARWIEIGRSRLTLADLVGTAKAIPYPIGPYFESGVPAVAVKKWRFYCHHEIVIKNAHGEVGTAPSGGACIVDIMDDGASIFTNQSEMINIADGTTSDMSADKDHVFAAGSIITIEVEAANSAADLTVSFDAYIAPQTPP